MKKLILSLFAIVAIVASIIVGTVTAAQIGGPQMVPYVDDVNMVDGPHWVVKIVFPSGITTFAIDPAPIGINNPTDAASWFPNTQPSDWHSIQEGEFVAWVFHSNNGQTKNLSVPFGTLQVSETGFVTSGQPPASVQDATWRFGNRSAATTPSPAPQPAPAPIGTLNACPTTSNDASLMGGSASAWNVIPSTGATGWHYEGASALLTAPSFGRLDTPAGGLRNGQQTNTGVATFWCQG